MNISAYIFLTFEALDYGYTMSDDSDLELAQATQHVIPYNLYCATTLTWMIYLVLSLCSQRRRSHALREARRLPPAGTIFSSLLLCPELSDTFPSQEIMASGMEFWALTTSTWTRGILPSCWWEQRDFAIWRTHILLFCSCLSFLALSKEPCIMM